MLTDTDVIWFKDPISVLHQYTQVNADTNTLLLIPGVRSTIQLSVIGAASRPLSILHQYTRVGILTCGSRLTKPNR